MDNKTLGVIAMACAPFLFFADFTYFNPGADDNHTSLGGVFNLIYMTGWTLSVIGLYRMKAMGRSLVAKGILIIQFLFLGLASLWNIYEIVSPGSSSPLYRFLDIFWPLSNLMMFFTGLALVFANVLSGWTRFVPLGVGLWFPLMALILTLNGGRTYVDFYISGIYSTTLWMLMAYVVYFRTKIPLKPAVDV